MNLAGRTAVVTGAGSGIGRALAIALAERHCHLALAAFPAAVALHHLKVDLLVNNAGVALGGTFEEISEADFQWLFNIQRAAGIIVEGVVKGKARILIGTDAKVGAALERLMPVSYWAIMGGALK